MIPGDPAQALKGPGREGRIPPSRVRELCLALLVLAACTTLFVGCRQTILRDKDRTARVETPSTPFPMPLEDGPAEFGYHFGKPAFGEKQKLYYVARGKAQLYESMIKELYPGTKYVKIFPNFLQDTRNGGKGGADLLIIRDVDERVRQIEEFFKTLQTSIPQVEVEARIIEIVTGDEFQLGTTATLTEQDANPKTLFDTLASTTNSKAFLDSLLPGNTGGFQGGLFTLGTIQDETIIDLVIEALARDDRTELVSTPQIRVLSGYNAEIVTGEETPVQQVQVVNAATNFTTVFKKTGIRLEITPVVVSDNVIRMQVRPEVSLVTAFTDPAVSGGLANPIISTRHAETTVNVPSNNTLIIGGLKSSAEVEVDSRVPILGRIPILGLLFSSTRRERVDTELWFFIQVKVISGGNTPPDTVLPLPE